MRWLHFGSSGLQCCVSVPFVFIYSYYLICIKLPFGLYFITCKEAAGFSLYLNFFIFYKYIKLNVVFRLNTKLAMTVFNTALSIALTFIFHLLGYFCGEQMSKKMNTFRQWVQLCDGLSLIFTNIETKHIATNFYWKILLFVHININILKNCFWPNQKLVFLKGQGCSGWQSACLIHRRSWVLSQIHHIN